MKIPKVESVERERFMMELFKAEPDLSIPRANDKLAAKYGARLNLGRAYQLRDMMIQAPPPRLKAEASVTPLRLLHRHDEPVMLLAGSKTELQWFQKVIKEIARSGLANLKIDHVAQSYVTVRSAH